MTPEQQSALEDLTGTTLSAEQMMRIDAYMDPNNRNDVRIAEILSDNRVKYVKTAIGPGTVVAAMDGQGGAFIDTIIEDGKTDRDLYWGTDSLRNGVIDLSVKAARDWIVKLQSTYPQYADGLAKLLAMGVAEDPLSYIEVSKALNKSTPGIETL